MIIQHLINKEINKEINKKIIKQINQSHWSLFKQINSCNCQYVNHE